MMEEIRLGKTELRVTKLGMGGLQLAKISEDEAVRVVRTGLDLGITFVETARGYWDSEEKLGKAITGRREAVILATKAADRDGAGMAAAIDKSLATLATDYIDLYQCHACDTPEQYEQIIGPGGALEAMVQAKEAGKIRAIGFSSHQLQLSLDILENDSFTSAQLPISFMNTENHEQGLFAKADEHDVGLIAMKPFGGGRLAEARLVMAYSMSLAKVASVVGADTVEHVRELAELAENPPMVNDQERAEMAQIKEELGTRFCRACNYCQPCPEQIEIYRVLWVPVYLAQMGVERALSKKTIEAVRKGEACTQCRQCEQRCPFDLEIVDGLQQSRDIVERLITEHQLE